MTEQVIILETGGFMPSIVGMRLPTQSKNDSYNDGIEFILGEKDKQLAKSLLNKKERMHWTEDDYIYQGDVHGKFQRSIITWLDITAPRKIWSELDTYTVGVTPTSSTSTMYTLRKELRDINAIDASMFDKYTDQVVIDNFKLSLTILMNKYGSDIKDIPIDVLKSALPDGWLQRRIKSFSYQTLRRLYLLRKNHRLLFWKNMCTSIEQLPYFNELLLGV